MAAESRMSRREPCGDGKKLRVHFYNVGQALAAMVELPDGKHLLVDTGDKRDAAGEKHLVAMLKSDLDNKPIDLLWVTHQHSDHIGGVPRVAAAFRVVEYVDNGTGGKTKKRTDPPVEEVVEARKAVKGQKQPASLTVIDPSHTTIPLSGVGYTLSAVVPEKWVVACNLEPNDCSIGLRVDYCESSILFTGDAEGLEENKLPIPKPVTLLQVGHHGSITSSSVEFIKNVKPKYAVISAGKPNVGMNKGYCHPNHETVERLTNALGGAEAKRFIPAFVGNDCKAKAAVKQWHDIAASGRLWATEVDDDVVLETAGDGEFVRVRAPSSSAAVIVKPGRDEPRANGL
jgi:competence protein ComEC